MSLLQKDADKTPLFVPDSPSSSGTESESTDTEEIAAYCQVRNIWTILGGNLNKPGAKQATKVRAHTLTLHMLRQDASCLKGTRLYQHSPGGVLQHRLSRLSACTAFPGAAEALR